MRCPTHQSARTLRDEAAQRQLCQTLGLLIVASVMVSSGNREYRSFCSLLVAVLGAVAPALSLAASSDGQYFLPGEFVGYVLFLFLPPLLMGFAAQAWVFVSRGMPHPVIGGRALASFALTALVSVGFAAVLFVSDSRALAPVLRVREVSLAGGSWPISPLAFLAVALVAPITIWWGARRAA